MRSKRVQSAGFTRMELFVVVALIALLAGMVLLPSLAKAKSSSSRISCVNNLKIIGIATRVWTMDHGGLVPTLASESMGGLYGQFPSPSQGGNCWKTYGVMATELGMAPKVVICPSDERIPATNFIVKGSSEDKGDADFKGNEHVSYFTGVGASDFYPLSLLAGDRNMAPGIEPVMDYGFSPKNDRGNDIILQTNTPICWSLKCIPVEEGKGLGICSWEMEAPCRRPVCG